VALRQAVYLYGDVQWVPGEVAERLRGWGERVLPGILVNAVAAVREAGGPGEAAVRVAELLRRAAAEVPRAGLEEGVRVEVVDVAYDERGVARDVVACSPRGWCAAGVEQRLPVRLAAYHPAYLCVASGKGDVCVGYAPVTLAVNDLLYPPPAPYGLFVWIDAKAEPRDAALAWSLYERLARGDASVLRDPRVREVAIIDHENAQVITLRRRGNKTIVVRGFPFEAVRLEEEKPLPQVYAEYMGIAAAAKA